MFLITAVQCHGGNQFIADSYGHGVNHSEATKICQQRGATLPFRTSSNESEALSCLLGKLHPLAMSRWIHLHFWRQTCSSPSMCDLWAIARNDPKSSRVNSWPTSKRDGFIFVMCEQGRCINCRKSVNFPYKQIGTFGEDGILLRLNVCDETAFSFVLVILSSKLSRVPQFHVAWFMLASIEYCGFLPCVRV